MLTDIIDITQSDVSADFPNNFSGLIGITIDRTDIFLVNINDHVKFSDNLDVTDDSYKKNRPDYGGGQSFKSQRFDVDNLSSSSGFAPLIVNVKSVHSPSENIATGNMVSFDKVDESEDARTLRQSPGWQRQQLRRPTKLW